MLASGTVLAHITDAHVSARGRRTAVLTDKSVEILEDLVEQCSSLRVDALLFGGDNIDNKQGSEDMEIFLQVANKADRWLCIAGNHEARHPQPGGSVLSKLDFADAVDGHGISPGRYSFSEVIGNVRIIGIDTTLIGTSGGYVSDATLGFLARELRSADEDHILVIGHHLLAAPWAPYRLESWDADYLVKNRDPVVALLATSPKVRAYLCGHHHASRIHRIAGRGEGGGFYHILTPSPAAYPHAARILRFEDEALVVETIRPRLEGIIDEGLQAVLTGRKARRFETLGASRSFTDYVRGRRGDNEAVLPYHRGPRKATFVGQERRAASRT